MSSIFEALADPTRQRILALLRDGERPVGDLVDSLGVAQPSVSKHLARLKAAGLVDLRAEAQRRVYRLTPEPLREIDGWLTPYLRDMPGGAPAPLSAPAGEDTVTLAKSEARQGSALVFEASTGGSADALWAAICDPARLELWLGKASVQPGQGGRFRVVFAGTNVASGGKINVWSPRRKLGYRWRLGPEAEDPITNVLFEIAYGERGADLILTHDRIPPDVADELAAIWSARLERFGAAVRA